MNDARTNELVDKTVACLYGGQSSEREISLLSGAGIAEALEQVTDGRGPARTVRVEIDAEGAWRLDGDAYEPTEAVRRAGADVWFLGLHGGDGEDGGTQAFLEQLAEAYTGSGPRASALAMNKFAATATVQRAGLSVPRGRLARRESLDHLERFDAIRSSLGWFVKPNFGGSSVGAGLARDRTQLEARLTEALEFDEFVLVEEAIEGVEASVGVLDFVGSEPRSLPPVEIRPRESAFFDYEEKYSESGAIELCPPAAFDASICQSLERAALEAHRTLGLTAYSRSDFLVVDTEVIFLEANTLPGFTARSLVPNEARVEGISYRELCLAIAVDGHRRGRR